MSPFSFRKFACLILSVVALASMSCGKKTKSQEVQISVEPPTPIVFTSDTTIKSGDEEKTVKAPWFAFSVRIDNHLDKSSVTIMSLHVEAQGFDAEGQLVTSTSDILPAGANFSNNTQECTYTDFGQFDAGGTRFPGSRINDELLFSIPDGGSAGCPVKPHLFYMTAPKLGTTGVLSYRVKVTPIGWFGPRNEQIDRFDNFTTFYTR